MPTAPVDSIGTIFYYEDTGTLEGPYTTLVLVHGTGVHGAIFRPMYSFAAENRWRLIVPNRRDYPGTTPFSDEELATIMVGCSDEAGDSFLRARALEVAEFLAWFVRTQDIHPVSHDENGDIVGGLVLLGWSSGNGTLLSLFANLEYVPKETRDVIEPYLRSYIHFDGPRWSLGFPHVERFPRPLMNPKLNEDQRWEAFKFWVSAYYLHPAIETRSYEGLATDPSPDRAATFDCMSLEDQEATTSRTALFHSEMLVRVISPRVYNANTHRALFERKWWSNIPVKMLQCKYSLWEMLTGMWEVEQLYTEKRREGVDCREMEFALMEANHVPQWDQPRDLAERVADLI
ncbi:hypothetical protein BC834DRAFT_879885 [Gloeopeniophorella convolvens]|nr:hypothetical protein BC834DRAFT_879885 [Gloeopeniophorella convolvens]